MEGSGRVTARDELLDALTEAAVEWAAGGRGRRLVDAAAEALAGGVDSPTLRVLAGAPRATGEEEATELAPTVFHELGIGVHERLSTEAVLAGARQRARAVLAGRESPRVLARDLYAMYVSTGHADQLADWTGFDDLYRMLEDGILSGRVEDVDAAVIDAARALTRG